MGMIWMEQFILADMRRKLLEEDEQQTIAVAGADERLARLDALLRAAEQKADAWEQMGGLNPHVNVLRGPKWKVFLKRLIRKLTWFLVRPLVEQQNYFNALTNGMGNELRDSIWILKELVWEQRQSLAELEAARRQSLAKLEETRRSLAKLEEGHRRSLAELEEVRRQSLAELEEVRRQSLTKLEETRRSLAEVEKAQRRSLAGLEESQKELHDACLDELEKTRVELEALRVKLADTEESVFDYIDYHAFEDEFRGSQKEIRARLQRYLDYFKPGERVVDLGCGRGEWLELMVDKGIEAMGVDISENFVAMCRDKGLNVVQEDMFSYLERQPDHSLDGITAIQVVEHITPAALAKLVGLCYRKLKLGGRVIFETQNPKSVSALANNFYIDPDHKRPVHPRWLEYLFKASSFTEISADYPEYAWVTDGSIPALPGDDESIKIFNQRISYLNNFLYGSTDYAVIARK